jgi:hypothetical protein
MDATYRRKRISFLCCGVNQGHRFYNSGRSANTMKPLNATKYDAVQLASIFVDI